MAKKRKISYKKIFKFIIILLIINILIIVSWYKLNIRKVSSNTDMVEFEITDNDTLISVADRLSEKGLIRSVFAYKLYIKIHNPSALQIGVYPLNKNMNVSHIINILSGNPDDELSTIKITFPEGINMRKVASLIGNKTKYKADDLYNILNDSTYLDKLISKYWFLNDDIKNNNIYYSLEGYLFPDTYTFKRNADIKTIIETMLDNTNNKLENYKSSIENSNYSVHQLLTLASVVELEASTAEDRKGVAGVFYNRLNSNMGLESDVTTYYGLKKDLTESIAGHVYDINAYNTRSTTLYGKLPVGPICNMSSSSIEAVLNPTKSNNYYFVADTNKKVYFTKTYTEHLKIIASLKDQGLWNA